MEPLGSLLQPVVADLLADGVRDLILIPASPAALLPWAAATVRWPGDSHPTPVRELLTLSVAPSAAAVSSVGSAWQAVFATPRLGGSLSLRTLSAGTRHRCRAPGTRLTGSTRHSSVGCAADIPGHVDRPDVPPGDPWLGSACNGRAAARYAAQLRDPLSGFRR